jgi:hypothetical protein
MPLALNIPAQVSPPCLCLPHTFLSANAKQWHKRYHLLLGFVDYTFPFTVSLPLPILCCLFLSFPLLILFTLPFPSSFHTALHVLLTLVVVIVIAIAGTALSTARPSRIRQVLIIIILIDYLIPTQWSNGQEVAWLVLPAPRWLNLCHEIIATVPTEMLAGAFNLPHAGYLRMGAIDLLPDGTGVVPPPIVHLVAGFVKH